MTRTLLAGAAFLTLGLGTVHNANAQLQMKGSDTLEDIVKDAIIGAGLTSSITYVGGGSTGGQGTLTSSPPTQQIAPMSRELNGAACTTLGATIGQEMIGLDGLSIVAANQTGGDSQADTAGTGDDCSDNITGGISLAVPGCTTAMGCDASGNYVFTDWKDVLAMVYGGQNHTSATQLLPGGATCTSDATCTVPGEVCVGAPSGRCGVLADRFKRNPNRIDCNGIVRKTLVNSWGSLFQDVAGGAACRTGSCTKLKHAFRRDDISGTTDTFVTLVGLPAIPAFTSAFDGSPTFAPKPDSTARPSPFCNGGSALQNKGDSDYQDLDPIRRAVDHNNTLTATRPGLELVGQASLPAFGGNNNDANCEPADHDTTVAGTQARTLPTDSSSSTQPGILPAAYIAGAEAKVREELGFADPASGGAAILKPNTRTCLGLVLPIAMPGNYTSEDAYFGANAAGTVPPVACSTDPATGSIKMAFVIPDTQHSATALCPDGKKQPCRLPVNTDSGTNNFNCYVVNTNPTILPLRDNRGFNLHPLQANGQYKRDNYVNPFIPVASLSAARQNRVVTAFYRLHFNAVTNVGGSVPTLPAGQFCRSLSATNQIGCLVKASSCSIGFAGREAIDELAVGDNFAFRVAGIQPSKANIENLVTTPATAADDYPISRRLWVNSVIGFAAVTGNELTLLNYMRNPATIDSIVAARNFIPVPAGVSRSRGCPAGP
jgi:hypothetical protein